MNKLILFDIDYTLFDTATFKESNLTNYSLYVEIAPLLKDLSKTAMLGIFSQGEVDFQKKKLKETGIDKHFIDEYINIVESKIDTIETVIDKYKNYEIFLIDDRIDNLEMAKRHNPNIKTVWVKRGPFAVRDTRFIPDKSIEDLRQLLDFVRYEK